MVPLKDEEESIPFRRNPTGLNIAGEHHRRLVIVVSQFKAEAVGFELDMAGEPIEKRQNGKPEEGQQEPGSAEMTPGRKVRRIPSAGRTGGWRRGPDVGEPESRQQATSEDCQPLPVVAHKVMLQLVADGEYDLVRCLGRL
jgi:hypothetical protein